MTERQPDAAKHPGKKPTCGHRGPCPLDDRCPMCDATIRAHDRAWLLMTSDWGLTIGANYCSPKCEGEAAECAELVGQVLRHRKTLMSAARV